MSLSHTEAWLRMLEEVGEQGLPTSPRSMATKELTFTQHTVRDPLTFPLHVKGREFRDVIGVLEGLSLVGEFSVPELFTTRVKKFGSFMDGGIMWGAYGARTHGALGDAAELIERDRATRQAVVSFYDSKRDLNRVKRDVPCTISAQFLLRARRDGPSVDDFDEYLDLGISMRSNDLWIGTPYDLTQFSILQASLAQALQVRVGYYYHRVGSLHLYSRDFEKLDGIAWEGGPAMPFPLWNPSVVDEYPTALDKTMAIQRRARMLALGELDPVTPFEHWAQRLLDE